MTAAEPLDLRIAYIGNFDPPHSTENHVALSFESIGVDVLRLQENDARSWSALPFLDVAFVLWTRTWPWPLPDTALAAFARAQATMPIVGYHLDRLWGLQRQSIIPTELWFRSDLLITADGGHEQQWADAGIEHRWLPPAVYADGIGPVRKSHRRPADVAFVGSWQRYHEEWPHRMQLVRHLRSMPHDVAFYPLPGEPAVRGQALDELYARVPVLVGDSCMAGDSSLYWSDRIPETLGRGGFLIHPEVVGLRPHFEPGEHLVTFRVGDFAALDDSIAYFLAHPDERRAIAEAGRLHTLEHHTYEVRARQIVDLVREAGLS